MVMMNLISQVLPGKMNRLDETASGSFSLRLPVHNKLDCPNCGLSKLWTLQALDSPNWSALQTLDQIGHQILADLYNDNGGQANLGNARILRLFYSFPP